MSGQMAIDGKEFPTEETLVRYNADYIESKSIEISTKSKSTEEPLQPSKRKKFDTVQWITLLTLAFGNLCVGACVSLQAPFFPKEAESKGTTATEYGLIFGSYTLTVFFCSPLMGKLIGYLEAKFLLNSGVFCLSVTCVCFGLLDFVDGRGYFVGLAFAIRILEGVGATALKISSYSIIAVQFSDTISTAYAILETFFGIGLICGPTVGGALYDVGGYGLPFYVVGFSLLLDSLLIFVVLPKPERSESQKVGNLTKFWMSPITLMYASVVFSNFIYIGFNSATLEPHVRQFNLPGVYLGMLFALSGTMYAILAPVWGWLCDKKLDNKILSIFGCLIMIVSLFLIGPMPFLGLQRNIGIIITGLALMGIGTGMKLVPTFGGTLKDTVARGFSPDMSTYGLISSMFTASQSLGAFVGPSAGGYILDTIGYDYGVLAIILLEVVVVTSLIIYTVVTKIRNTSSTDSERQRVISDKEKQASYS